MFHIRLSITLTSSVYQSCQRLIHTLINYHSFPILLCDVVSHGLEISLFLIVSIVFSLMICKLSLFALHIMQGLTYCFPDESLGHLCDLSELFRIHQIVSLERNRNLRVADTTLCEIGVERLNPGHFLCKRDLRLGELAHLKLDEYTSHKLCLLHLEDFKVLEYGCAIKLL